jgi:hypothetical protein
MITRGSPAAEPLYSQLRNTDCATTRIRNWITGRCPVGSETSSGRCQLPEQLPQPAAQRRDDGGGDERTERQQRAALRVQDHQRPGEPGEQERQDEEQRQVVAVDPAAPARGDGGVVAHGGFLPG